MRHKSKRGHAVSFALAIVALAAPALAGRWDREERERLSNAARVVDQLLEAPDRGIPRDLLDRASCVAVIPSMKKAGLVFGGRYGKGAVSCRRPEGGWSAPAMVVLQGGSFGLQIGVSAVDVVMLIMNPDGIELLLRSQFTVGGDASVAAGPVGRAGTAETDALMTAKILTWSRSRGVFAGLELKGAVLKQDRDANRDLYDRAIDAKEILLTDTVEVPAGAQVLVGTLTRHSANPGGKSP